MNSQESIQTTDLAKLVENLSSNAENEISTERASAEKSIDSL